MSECENITINKNHNCSIEKYNSNRIVLPKIRNAFLYKNIDTTLKVENKTENKKPNQIFDNNPILFSKKIKYKDYLQLKFKKKSDEQKENSLEKLISNSNSIKTKTSNNFSLDSENKIDKNIGKSSIFQKKSEGQQTDQNINAHFRKIDSKNKNVSDNLIINKNRDDSRTINSNILKNKRKAILMNFQDYCFLVKEDKKKENINFVYKKFNEYKLNIKKLNNTRININNIENKEKYKNYDIFDYKKDFKKFMRLISQQNSEKYLDDIKIRHSKRKFKTESKYKEYLSYNYKIKNDVNNNDISRKDLKSSSINKGK